MMFLVALRKEMLEQWRSYRLLVLSVVFVSFGLSSPLLATLTPELLRLVPGGESLAQLVPAPTVADAVAQYVKNLSQFGILLAIVLTMGAVAQETDKGTAAMTLAKPIPRWAFLGAKFAALAASFTIATALAALGAYYYTLLLFEPPDIAGWLGLNGLLLLFFLVFVAFTLFASTVSHSQVVAGAMAFGYLAPTLTLGALPGVRQYLPVQLPHLGNVACVGCGRARRGRLWASVSSWSSSPWPAAGPCSSSESCRVAGLPVTVRLAGSSALSMGCPASRQAGKPPYSTFTARPASRSSTPAASLAEWPGRLKLQ